MGRGHKKATNEQIVSAYREYGSIWKAAKALGMCGQTVWERLKRLNHEMYAERWTSDEIVELRSLVSQCKLGEIARRLGRSYAGVAAKISELGIGTRHGNSTRYKVSKRPALTRDEAMEYLNELREFDGPIRQFCLQRSLDIEFLTRNIQQHDSAAWKVFVRSRSDLAMKECPQCGDIFVPMNGKQQTCSRKCTSLRRIDLHYFSGNRSNTVGLAEGECQLCRKQHTILSSHHVYGRENDRSSELLVALCAGCHHIVGNLAGKSGSDSHEFWESLIALSMLRRNGHRAPSGYHVTVEIEEMTGAEAQEEMAA